MMDCEGRTEKTNDDAIGEDNHVNLGGVSGEEGGDFRRYGGDQTSLARDSQTSSSRASETCPAQPRQ